jgi:hypothetical protein
MNVMPSEANLPFQYYHGNYVTFVYRPEIQRTVDVHAVLCKVEVIRTITAKMKFCVEP